MPRPDRRPVPPGLPGSAAAGRRPGARAEAAHDRPGRSRPGPPGPSLLRRSRPETECGHDPSCRPGPNARTAPPTPAGPGRRPGVTDPDAITPTPWAAPLSAAGPTQGPGMTHLAPSEPDPKVRSGRFAAQLHGDSSPRLALAWAFDGVGAAGTSRIRSRQAGLGTSGSASRPRTPGLRLPRKPGPRGGPTRPTFRTGLAASRPRRPDLGRPDLGRPDPASLGRAAPRRRRGMATLAPLGGRRRNPPATPDRPKRLRFRI